MKLHPQQERKDIIAKYRQSQPLAELLRKAKKANRKGIWTQEEIDFGKANGKMLADFFEN